MFEAIIMALIYLCVFAGAVFLILWVLGQVGIVIPPRILQLFWVVITLVAILVIYKMFAPQLSGIHLPGTHGITVEQPYR